MNNRITTIAVLLACAAVLGACNEASASTVEKPNRVAVETVDLVETNPPYQLPTDPNGILTVTPPVLNGDQVDNRYDSFAPNEIGVCNSKYQVPQALQDQIFAIMNDTRYKFESTFYVIDLKSGMSIGYNADVLQATASTVKAGFCYAAMVDIQNTEHTLNDKMVYKPIHKLSGSGSTQHSTFGTIFTIESLLFRTMYNSDNTAYYMLLDYFGTDLYNEMMAELGVSHRLDWDEERWGYMTAQELGLIWQAIYRFRDKGDEGAFLWKHLTTNMYNEIGDTLTEYDTIAHKSGWNEEGYHDSGVVCTANGNYVVVVMTKTGDRNNCLHRLVRALDDVMKDYYTWEKNQTQA